ncbi:MAG: hypothetical protein AAGD86_00020 [Pseudomonadota bacterium]
MLALAVASATALWTGIARAVDVTQEDFDASPVNPFWQPLGEASVGGRVTSILVSPHDAQRVLIGGEMLGVGLSLDQGDTWQTTTGFFSWEIGDFTWHPTDPQRVWVGTMGGPYLSTDGGRTWTRKRSGFPALENFDFSAPIEKVLYDPNDAQHLLAAGGTSRRWRVNQVDGAFGAVWESVDGGEQWTRLTTLTASGSSTAQDADGINIVGMAFGAGSSTRVYASVDNQGFYRSDDGGVTWTKQNGTLPALPIERVLAHPTLVDTVFVTYGNEGTAPGGVYRSENGGNDFVAVNTGLDQFTNGSSGNTSRYKGVALDPVTGTRLIAADDRFGSAGIFITNDGGAGWSLSLARSAIDLPYPSSIEMEVATIAGSDPDVMFLGGSANLVRSVDGGFTWDDAGNVTLGDERYRGRGYSGLVSTEITFNPRRRGHLLAQGFDGARVLQSLDDGATWTFEANQTGAFGGGADAVFAGGDVAYASIGFQGAYQGVGRTLDGGQSWEVIAGSDAGLPEVGTDVRAGGIFAARQNPATVWTFVGDDLYRSVDSGTTWSVVAAGIGNGWVAGSPDGTLVYASGDNGTYRSDDGIAFDFIGGPARPGKLATGADGRLWHAAHDETGNEGLGLWTWTEGEGWTAVLDPEAFTGDFKRTVEYLVNVALSPSDPQTIAFTTADPPFRDESRASGVWLSRDGGATWATLNQGLPMLRGAALAFDPFRRERLVVGTAGRGFYSIDLPAR